MPKYKIYWSATISGSSEVEANSEEEACKYVKDGNIDYATDIESLENVEVIDSEELEIKNGSSNIKI
jgi:hypothetical protein